VDDVRQHDHAHEPVRGLTAALVATVAFMGVEVAVGVYSGSLALLADAGHMLSDAGALVLALAAQRLAIRPPSARGTYGYRRAEVLAAFVNGAVLAVLAFWILGRAWDRWSAPRPVLGGPLLATAIAGLVVNLAVAKVLHGGRKHNLNVEAALWHVLSDALGSVAAIAAGVCVLWLGWMRADALLSAAVALLVGFSAWRLVRRTVLVLLETTPPGVDLADLEKVICGTPGVRALHDLHAWRISDGFDAVTVHVVLDGSRHGPEVAADVARRVHDRTGIDHVTVQPEVGPPEAIVKIGRRR